MGAWLISFFELALSRVFAEAKEALSGPQFVISRASSLFSVALRPRDVCVCLLQKRANGAKRGAPDATLCRRG